MTSKEWKLARRTGIGGSDAAAILGLSPWKSAMDVWLEKMGLAEENADPDRQFLLDLGNELEPVIAKMYSRQTGRFLYQPEPLRVIHRDFTFLAGTPDRLVAGESRGVELKTENQFVDQFGEPGTDQVPYHYLVQCAHYMAVCDVPVWDVALLHGGAAFSIYTIERDRELESDMIDQLRAWWERHVVAKTPPDVDGSAAWKVYLRKKFPSDILPIKDADNETLMLVNNLRTVRQIVEEYSGIETDLQNRLKLLIGEHEGLAGEFGKITWRKTKGRKEIDWERAYRHIEPVARVYMDTAKILDGYTTAREGVRRFLFTPRRDWHYGEQRGAEAAISQGPAPVHTLPGDGEHSLGSASQSDDRGPLHHGGTTPPRS